jgi:hypothetical protein
LNWLGVSRCRLVAVDGLDPPRRRPRCRRSHPDTGRQAVVRGNGATRRTTASCVDHDHARRLFRTRTDR